MTNGDLVESLEALGLGKAHVNEFGIHAFDVCEDEEVLDAGVFAHVAFQARIGIAAAFKPMAPVFSTQSLTLIL